MGEAFSDYQVFLNHRGPDVKSRLASLLYSALHRSGLRVFLDRNELTTGNCVSTDIEAAIKSSSVQIAIFSPKYAESPWCLRELYLMLQQRPYSTIIPIFCDVKPSDLRRVNEGPYAEAFTKHRDRGTMEVARWEEALKDAAAIEGHEFHTEKGDWGEFIDKMVDVVLKKARREPLMVTNYPVGLDKTGADLYNEILKRMKPSARTTIVGIAGLCGSGKTTLITHLYNLKHSLFRRSSVLYEVCKSTSVLTSLQEKLLFDMQCCYQHIWSPQQGMSLLRQNLRGLSRVLIVLDGIDRQEQIDSLLLPVKDVLVDGSLIVITSRDKDLLERCQVSFLYNMKLLDEEDATQLFCLHAFRTPEAPTGFEDLVTEMVKMCGGYPLALKDTGARLLGKSMWHWKSQLTNLRENQFPNELVEKMVKATYDSLEEEAKAIFLDIASSFEGLDSHLVLVVTVERDLECRLLDWIETLGQKCLVEFDCVEDVYDDNMDFRPHKRRWRWWFPEGFPYRDCKIGMNKLVVDMAKKIASEEHSPCLSSDYNKLFQLMLAQSPPHAEIEYCYCLTRFRDLKYRMVSALHSFESRSLGVRSCVLGIKPEELLKPEVLPEPEELLEPEVLPEPEELLKPEVLPEPEVSLDEAQQSLLEKTSSTVYDQEFLPITELRNWCNSVQYCQLETALCVYYEMLMELGANDEMDSWEDSTLWNLWS